MILVERGMPGQVSSHPRRLGSDATRARPESSSLVVFAVSLRRRQLRAVVQWGQKLQPSSTARPQDGQPRPICVPQYGQAR